MSNFVHSLYQNFNQANTNNCLVINNQSFSYSQVSKKIADIQVQLKQFLDESLLGLLASNHINTYASIIACWLSGKGFVMIHPEHPPGRNAEIINQSKINSIICPEKKFKNFQELNMKEILIGESVNDSSVDIILATENQIAAVLFTSGSTGVPKGVPMTFRNINSTLDSFFALDYNLSDRDKFLQMFELTFDMSMLSYLPAFTLGASVFTVGNDKIKYLEAAGIMQKYRISFAAMVPSTLSLLRPYFSKLSFPELRYSILGGEPFYEDIARLWSRIVPNAQVINISGPTEITMACMGYAIDSQFKSNKTHNGILAFGKPWKNTKAIIVDDNQKQVETGETGELCFAGEHVMHGYLNQPDISNNVFFEQMFENGKFRFYKTGDMAFQDNEGDFYSCGRKDKQVKIQGFKVELEEIDFAAKNIPEVMNSCSLVRLNSGLSEIVLYVESDSIETEKIRGALKNTLPYYMIPSQIIILKEFPYSLNGKIDRQKLIEMNNP